MTRFDGANGGPWWAQGWRGILTLGPLAAIALVLVGALIGWVPSPITIIAQRLEAHMREADEGTRLLREICLSMAKTPDAQHRCVSPRSLRELVP